MKNVDSAYITGIIYTELDQELGPKPIAWMPENLDPRITMHVGIKGITMLTAEQGKIPDSSVILPFPSLNLKGMIKYLEWPNIKLRGEVGLATITILFREADDMIFYKFFKEIESILDNTAIDLIEMEVKGRNETVINEMFREIHRRIDSILDQFKIEEKIRLDQHFEFPEKLKPNPDVYQFKLIICGNPHVGKTSLILRYINKVFDKTYLPTLGVNVSSKLIQIEDVVVQLVIWDVAGQAKFEYMRTAFYKGARSAFFVFDLTDPESFQSIKKWSNDVKSNLGKEDIAMGFIIGNKKDLLKRRLVPKVDAIHLAEELNLEYFETSALTGENVDLTFKRLAQNLLSLSR